MERATGDRFKGPGWQFGAAEPEASLPRRSGRNVRNGTPVFGVRTAGSARAAWQMPCAIGAKGANTWSEAGALRQQRAGGTASASNARSLHSQRRTAGDEFPSPDQAMPDREIKTRTRRLYGALCGVLGR